MDGWRRHARASVMPSKMLEKLSKVKTYESSFGFDERPVLAVHLVVEAAGVAQVVARPVPPPQRRGRRPAVDALAALFGQVPVAVTDGSCRVAGMVAPPGGNGGKHTHTHTHTHIGKMEGGGEREKKMDLIS